MTDLERLRLRDAGLVAPDPDRAPGGSPAFVGKVTTAAPAVGRFLLVNPVAVFGTEAEGSAGAFVVNAGASVPVYLLGPGVPAAGDLQICRSVDYRWVTERHGGVARPPSCSGCPSVPSTINAVVFISNSCTGAPAYTVQWTLNYMTGTFTYTSPSPSGPVTSTYTGGFWRSVDAHGLESVADQHCNQGAVCASYTQIALRCLPGFGFKPYYYDFYQSTSFPDLPDPNAGTGMDCTETVTSSDTADWDDWYRGSSAVCTPASSPPAFPGFYPAGAVFFGFGDGVNYWYVP